MCEQSQNPFKKLRKDMTLHEFANLLGVSVSTLQQLERGVIHAPNKALLKLHSLGYDPDLLQKEYDVWRQETQQQARAKLRADSFKNGGESGQ
ncbi:MAG: helix-turn-helix domain-containing protein [Vulcanimicrobiota bacterium]